MRLLRTLTLAVAAAVTAVLAVGSSAVAAPTLLDFKWTITGLPAGKVLDVLYKGGVSEAVKGLATAKSGYSVVLGKGIYLILDRLGSATVDQWLKIDSQSVTGTAVVPVGTNVTVVVNGHKSTLTSGPFSIPTGVSVLGAKPTPGPVRIQCKGGADACTATVPIAGGANDRKLDIELTDTNLRLLSVTAVPTGSLGGYVLTDGRFALGGSEYRVTLDADKANPKHARLLLRFGTGT